MDLALFTGGWIMDIFDIIGPVMVGPSSSHTAGAVRIGYVGQKLLAEPVVKAGIGLYGSFLRELPPKRSRCLDMSGLTIFAIISRRFGAERLRDIRR